MAVTGCPEVNIGESGNRNDNGAPSNSSDVQQAQSGPSLNDNFIKLVSQEGKQFFIDRSVAVSTSIMLKKMCSGPFSESSAREIPFPTVKEDVLCKFIEYLYFKYKYHDSK
eukprot:GHVU01222035.1.p4 GENE.GHVU01222035.1~~GHVU01222035.1.p4  ORF type:complete len:111 (+),score=20.16 GHVU01222035.1:149-481(+)